MFERFTDGARLAVVYAQEEARALKHNYIGTEHILLGLLREGEEKRSLVADVFEPRQITLGRARAQAVRIVGYGEMVTAGQIPFRERAKRVLARAAREALDFGHDYVGTEHLMLGLVCENNGAAIRILLEFDADSETIRNELIRMVHQSPISPSTQSVYVTPSATVRVVCSEPLRRLLRIAEARARDDGRSVVELKDLASAMTRHPDG